MVQALRKRARVQPGGRVEIQDDALPEGADADIILLLPEPAGGGAPTPSPKPPPMAEPGGLPLVDEEGRPVFLPERPRREGFTLVDLIGLAPSGRTAEEIDREIRDFRGEEDSDEEDA